MTCINSEMFYESIKSYQHEVIQMICWFENHGNNIQYNCTHVFLSPLVSNDKHGLPIDKINLRLSLSLYTARSLIPITWRDSHNVYIKPMIGI